MDLEICIAANQIDELSSMRAHIVQQLIQTAISKCREDLREEVTLHVFGNGKAELFGKKAPREDVLYLANKILSGEASFRRRTWNLMILLPFVSLASFLSLDENA